MEVHGFIHVTTIGNIHLLCHPFGYIKATDDHLRDSCLAYLTILHRNSPPKVTFNILFAMTVRAARVPVPGVPPFGFSAQYPIVAADVDRRNQFEHDGLEFLDRRSPYNIILKFDVPRYIIYSGYYDMNTYLLNRLHRAVRRGNLANPSTNPDDRSVRIVLTYSLADLDQVSFREVQTAVTALERIAFILRSRTTYETLTKELLPWSPEPQRLDAVRIYKWNPWTGNGVYLDGSRQNIH